MATVKTADQMIISFFEANRKKREEGLGVEGIEAISYINRHGIIAQGEKDRIVSGTLPINGNTCLRIKLGSVTPENLERLQDLIAESDIEIPVVCIAPQPVSS